jgi:hypothetical protein
MAIYGAIAPLPCKSLRSGMIAEGYLYFTFNKIKLFKTTPGREE